MKLDAIYDHLLTRARATARDQHADLPGGARLAVRAIDEQIVVSVARKKQRVGTTEEVTFKRICKVPEQARRIPETDQAAREIDGKTWHMVGWCWREEASVIRLLMPGKSETTA